MADYRQHPIDPQWVARFQAALKVNVTGIVTEETLQVFAQRQVDEGAKKPEPKFWMGSGRALAAKMFPDLSVKEQAFAAKAPPRAKGQAVSSLGSEDAAVRKHGYAGMADYVAKFQTMKFMGKSVVGHALFIERLQMAQRYLALKHPGMDDTALGKLFGVTSVSHYRPSTEANPQAYHGLGFAIDFNPANNPWILGTNSGKSKENREQTSEIIARATRFMGSGEAVDLEMLKGLGKKATTDEAFERLDASSKALRDYRAMGRDRSLLETHLAGPGVPADIKDQGADHWFKQIQADHLAYSKRNWKKGNKEDGLMDLNKSLVEAMRDAAGLSWGFIDIGDASGDIMHFDGRTIGLANDIRKAREASKAKS